MGHELRLAVTRRALQHDEPRAATADRVNDPLVDEVQVPRQSPLPSPCREGEAGGASRR